MGKLCAVVCVHDLSGAFLHWNSPSWYEIDLSVQFKKLLGIFADLSSILLFGQAVSSSGIADNIFLF